MRDESLQRESGLLGRRVGLSGDAEKIHAWGKSNHRSIDLR